MLLSASLEIAGCGTLSTFRLFQPTRVHDGYLPLTTSPKETAAYWSAMLWYPNHLG